MVSSRGRCAFCGGRFLNRWTVDRQGRIVRHRGEFDGDYLDMVPQDELDHFPQADFVPPGELEL